jgi:hypothetical protein
MRGGRGDHLNSIAPVWHKMKLHSVPVLYRNRASQLYAAIIRAPQQSCAQEKDEHI